MAQNDEYITEILLETSLINKSQLERARGERNGEETLVDVLIRQGDVTQEDVTRALAAHAAMDYVDLSAISVSDEVIKAVPREIAKRFKVIPIVESETGLMIAVGDPLNFDTFDSLQHLLQRDLEFVCATPEAIQAAYRKYYGTADEAADELEAAAGRATSKSAAKGSHRRGRRHGGRAGH